MKPTRARSNRILTTALLAVALLSGACESTPDVAHPQSYRKDGISFDYPGNWSVTEDAVQPGESGLRYLFVESPASALVIVQYYPRGTEMPIEEFSAEFHRRMLGEAEDLVRLGSARPIAASSGSTRSVRSVVAGSPRDGIEQAFSLSALGERVPHQYHAFKVEADPAAAFVIVQAAIEDWDLVAPGFDLVLASLQID